MKQTVITQKNQSLTTISEIVNRMKRSIFLFQNYFQVKLFFIYISEEKKLLEPQPSGNVSYRPFENAPKIPKMLPRPKIT